MESSDLIVLTPPGVANASLAIAACRAGAVGVVDLEFAPDPAAARAALRRLAEFTTAPFGVKLGRDADGLLADLPADRLGWVVLAGGDHEKLPAWLNIFHDRGATVLLE